MIYIIHLFLPESLEPNKIKVFFFFYSINLACYKIKLPSQ